MAEHPYDRYRRIQVETANPVQLIIMMYEGIARFLNRAAAQIEAAQHTEASASIERANAIVNELLGTLDFAAGADVARNLGSIYTMTIRETLIARLHKDPKKLKDLAVLYTDLKDGWAAIAGAKSAGAAAV